MVRRAKNRAAFASDHFHACTPEFMEDLRTPALIDRIGEPGKDRHLVLAVLPEDNRWTLNVFPMKGKCEPCAVKLAAKADAPLTGETGEAVQKEIVHVHGICHGDEKARKIIQQPGALPDYREICREEICPGFYLRCAGGPCRKNANVGVPYISNVAGDGDREPGMPDIEHLCLEETRALIVQDKFIREPQDGSKGGDLSADPPDTQNRKPHHNSPPLLGMHLMKLSDCRQPNRQILVKDALYNTSRPFFDGWLYSGRAR